jgi:FdhD protein
VNKKFSALRFTTGRPFETQETVAGEEALQIKINGNAYTITMRTPGQDKMLAAGLLFTEGVIKTREDIIDITEIPAVSGDRTLIVDVQVKDDVLKGKNLFNRSIASSASCGVCGKIELCDLLPPRAPINNSLKLDIERIPDLLQMLQSEQGSFATTGGTHAAGIFSIAQGLLTVMEDIGRHNAVDKAIGNLFMRDSLVNADILFISGRVSYEITAKCAEASIPFLLAVSAPSSLAVDFCSSNGITLIGFCRDNRATVYTHKENILQYTSRPTASLPAGKFL